MGVALRPDESMKPSRRLWLSLLVAALGGVLNFVCVATFDIWPLGWVAQVPLLWLILEEKEPRPALYGFVTGFVTNAGGFYWIVPFLQRFGHLPLVAAVPIFMLLVAYQALTFTLFAVALRRLRVALPNLPGGAVLVAPVLWVTIEMIVPFVFPWYLAISQAWVRPAIQIAELTGPLGVSALLMLANAVIYEAVAARIAKRAQPWRRLAVGAALVGAVLGWSVYRIGVVEARRAEAPALKLGMVQANIGITEKWRPELAIQHLAIHQKLSAELEQRGAELIIWPESSYPFAFRRDQAHDWPAGDRRQARAGFTAPLFFGTLTRDVRPKGGVYNSALLLDRDANVRGIFDKNILMVFGEYLPFYEQMQWLEKLIPEISNWSRGTEVVTFPFEHQGKTFQLGPMICYEDIFPSFGRRLAKLRPNLLINITNDAWFGNTSEPYEHMALSVLRAVELRVDLVRAVNTGVTAVIDSTGRVVRETHAVDPDETPNAPTETVLHDVRLQEPSTLYATLGEWFGGLCLLGTVVLGILALSASGRPLRWRLVAEGGLLLFGLIVVGSVLSAGPANLPTMVNLLAHRLTGLPESQTFPLGLRLAAIAAAASFATGYTIARRNRGLAKPAELETGAALCLVLLVPALLFGTLEGEQAGLVILTAAALGLGRLGARTGRRSAAPKAGGKA